jgi:hypothetical protein
MFEANVLKLVMKTIFINSNPFALLITNVRRNGAHLVLKKRRLKKIKECPLLRFECQEHGKTFSFCVKLWAYKLCN